MRISISTEYLIDSTSSKQEKQEKSEHKLDLESIGKEHRKEVKKLLKGLRAKTKEAIENNTPLPNFDLCSISVPGTNLFCRGNKGIAREQMPQLKGFPIPGTPASKMDLDKNGKVDIQHLFLDRLKEMGISTKRYKVDPIDLKATQNQLVGSKIAMRVKQLEKNSGHPKFTMPYFVSKDGYILDGHHGWAAVLCYEVITENYVKINVIQVNMKIKALVKLANDFMAEQGISKKSATGGEG